MQNVFYVKLIHSLIHSIQQQACSPWNSNYTRGTIKYKEIQYAYAII